MPKHAYLSASASHRWLACPPSAKLCANILDQASEYAQQGTDCHELCAYLVEKALGRDVIDPTENLTYYDAEMQNCAEEYRNYVLEQIEAAKEFCKDPQVMIEQRLDFSRWVENGFGTGDCVIVADEVLQIIDYKYGAKSVYALKSSDLSDICFHDCRYILQSDKLSCIHPIMSGKHFISAVNLLHNYRIKNSMLSYTGNHIFQTFSLVQMKRMIMERPNLFY